MAKTTSAITTKLYPMITKSLTSSNISKLKQTIGKFIEAHNTELYADFPYDRVYWSAEDVNALFKILNIPANTIYSIIQETYYSKISSFNPAAAKDEFTVAMICIIKYLYTKKMKKELELCLIYLAFSPKFYTSIHYGLFQVVTPRKYEHIAKYVVNNLSQKYDLKREGTVIGAVKSICLTWIDTYDDIFKDKGCDDEEIVYIIQQLHVRIKSFMKNLASLYYEAYEKKDYMTYDSDNVGEDNYHLADNDIFRGERYIDSTMSVISTNRVNYKICQSCSDSNIKTDEIRSIIESILGDNENIIIVRELISLIVFDFMENSKNKEVFSAEFLNYTMAVKPNTKNKNVIREKEIVESFLSENSPAFNRRKSRESTANSYRRAVLLYFTLLIYESNK